MPHHKNQIPSLIIGNLTSEIFKMAQRISVKSTLVPKRDSGGIHNEPVDDVYVNIIMYLNIIRIFINIKSTMEVYDHVTIYDITCTECLVDD